MANRSDDWPAQAEHDLQHARNAKEDGDYDWACFAAHQAAEKAVKGRKQRTMRNVFTDFASSRFIDTEAVVEQLRHCAARLKSEHKELEGVYLFGSFARGTATPRSDADIALLLVDTPGEKRDRLLDAAREVFSKAAVPVDLHVIGPDQITSARGLGAVVAREGIEL